ncbi:MAG: hypothetical protein EA392_00035 [Cryomorphaceae bacterium]|nr:MAG: hypothetical protein EA392_00035 [Cryomorphaceae bacterium]
MNNPAFADSFRFIHTTFKDNEELDESIKKMMLSRATIDDNYRRVYVEGEMGRLEGLVFTEWQQIDVIPEVKGRERFGLDFGYTNDPSVLVRVVESQEAFYIDEIFYQAGLTNRNIAAMLESNGLKKNYDEIIADSAEPKSIDEIRIFGYNVKPSVKGKDSINAGIDKLKSKKIFITKRSTNLIKEFRNYSWATDKEGKTTNKPIDAFNHGIDAARYALSLKQQSEIFIL